MKRRFAGILLAALLAVPGFAPAESAWPNTNFTFKRIGVPAPGTQKRITVQIDPNAPRPVPASAPSGGRGGRRGSSGPIPGASPQVGALDWFWLGVSPKIEDSGPGRLQLALSQMNKAPAGEAIVPPRLQALQEIARAHGLEILRRTVGTKVSPALVLSVIAVESAGDVDAKSRVGAQGLMQLMPATAERFGVRNALAADDNIMGGVAYLQWLMEEFDHDPILVLAAYNAGEGAVRDNAGVPPYPETRAYVPKVLAAWTVARGLCITPPELVTDGCVFQVNGG